MKEIKIKKNLMADYRICIRSSIKMAMPFVGMIFIFVLFAMTTDGRFTKLYNLRNILTQSMILMIMGVGVSFVMAHGNLAFYVGGEMALCAIVASLIGMINAWLAFPAALLTGILCCLFIAWVNVMINIKAVIAGMCIMFIGRALAQGLSLDLSLALPSELSRFDHIIVYLSALVVVFVSGHVMMEHTKIGKYNKAIGSNERAALFSGIRVGKYKTIAFIISGICVAICAMISLLQGRGVTANTGLGVEMNTLIALVLGGMPLTGGTSVRLRSTVIGSLSFFMLSNGLTLWGVVPELIGIIKAIVFLICVYFSYDRESGILPV